MNDGLNFGDVVDNARFQDGGHKIEAFGREQVVKGSAAAKDTAPELWMIGTRLLLRQVRKLNLD